MEGSDSSIPAAVLAGAFPPEGTVPVRRWRDPMVRAVSGSPFRAGVGFTLAAARTVVAGLGVVARPRGGLGAPISGAGSPGIARVARPYRLLARHTVAA